MDTNISHPTSSVGTAVSDFSRALDVSRRVQEHPYGTLAAALGVGYVLGGGLFTRLTTRLAKVGALVGVELVTRPLVEAALEAARARKAGGREDHEGEG
jgi:hypothetical protein